MENVLISLLLLVFTAYVAFHILILSRLVRRGAASIIVVYAMLRLLTLPLIAVGALLSLLYTGTQLGSVGIALLLAGAAVMLARLIIGGVVTSRQRRIDHQPPEDRNP